jgi:hypothetical protein
MSRKYLPENVYSFTTTLRDDYLARVLEEVAADTDFVVITEHNTLSGESEKAALAVRKTITSLGYFFPSLKLAGKPLVDWFHEAIESIVDDADTNEWSSVVLEGDSDAVAEELERIRNEVRRIKNIKDGRVVRVYVESF